MIFTFFELFDLKLDILESKSHIFIFFVKQWLSSCFDRVVLTLLSSVIMLDPSDVNDIPGQVGSGILEQSNGAVVQVADISPLID